MSCDLCMSKIYKQWITVITCRKRNLVSCAHLLGDTQRFYAAPHFYIILRYWLINNGVLIVYDFAAMEPLQVTGKNYWFTILQDPDTMGLCTKTSYSWKEFSEMEKYISRASFHAPAYATTWNYDSRKSNKVSFWWNLLLDIEGVGGTLLKLDPRLAEAMISLATKTNNIMFYGILWYDLCRFTAPFAQHFPKVYQWGNYWFQLICICYGFSHAHDVNNGKDIWETIPSGWNSVGAQDVRVFKKIWL